jgi:hypothetical protein
MYAFLPNVTNTIYTLSVNAAVISSQSKGIILQLAMISLASASQQKSSCAGCKRSKRAASLELEHVYKCLGIIWLDGARVASGAEINYLGPSVASTVDAPNCDPWLNGRSAILTTRLKHRCRRTMHCISENHDYPEVQELLFSEAGLGNRRFWDRNGRLPPKNPRAQVEGEAPREGDDRFDPQNRRADVSK